MCLVADLPWLYVWHVRSITRSLITRTVAIGGTWYKRDANTKAGHGGKRDRVYVIKGVEVQPTRQKEKGKGERNLQYTVVRRDPPGQKDSRREANGDVPPHNTAHPLTIIRHPMRERSLVIRVVLVALSGLKPLHELLGRLADFLANGKVDVLLAGLRTPSLECLLRNKVIIVVLHEDCRDLGDEVGMIFADEAFSAAKKGLLVAI